jgi:hypothetical protein
LQTNAPVESRSSQAPGRLRRGQQRAGALDERLLDRLRGSQRIMSVASVRLGRAGVGLRHVPVGVRRTARLVRPTVEVADDVVLPRERRVDPLDEVAQVFVLWPDQGT